MKKDTDHALQIKVQELKTELDKKNRELEIETSLERVRTVAMGMNQPNDMIEVCQVISEQLRELNVENIRNVQTAIINDKKETYLNYEYFTQYNTSSILEIQSDLHPSVLEFVQSIKKSKDAFFTTSFTGKDLEEWIEYRQKTNQNPDPLLDKATSVHYYFYSIGPGALGLSTYVPLVPKQLEIFKKFHNVFALTYKRFLDIQKAEAQAREAQIEAALERIRTKALAMQSSADLHGVSIVLREQMGILGQQDLESSIVHLYNDSTMLESWYTFRSTETHSTKIVTDVAFIPVDSCAYIKETLEKYQSTETEYTIVSKGKKLLEWYNVMVKVAPDTIEYNDEGKMLVPEILYYHHSKFLGGALLMISNQPPSEETKELQRRAAIVFNLAYQRFLDLQQAEERTRESIKQASLDRVRGEIASMRSKEDLNRITPLIWTELKALNVPFIRCGVLIMDEKRKVIQSYLSAPDGHSLGVYELPYESKEIANGALEHWRKGTMYIDHWTKDQFIRFMQNLIKLEQIDNPESYQDAAKPPESLVLHFVPFKQGMLYVGNTAPLSQDELQLVQSLAEAFSIAYARYEDFTQLEQAKNQIEIALGELKSTQSQLIHAEKMASLGELTAGIAHEIQNPLNFVNNFADVSADLIEEMHEEMESGNAEEVKAITDDIKLNLEKINHHGKRASDIVRGMLQHSRTSTGQKELTDINKLADEYLRLAYHGLRAKDKSFNANFKFDFDENLPKINVISQDISRVFLNIINNAFYAVSKSVKQGTDDYMASVAISTKKLVGQIEVRVKDNADGISPDVLGKIFQPFYTTKPTGQGTGLGLSLSYDIITKGHGGELKIDTKVGEGTEFIILLPE